MFAGCLARGLWGPIMRSTRFRNRSASWMMMRVYSFNPFGTNSRSSSWAATRIFDLVRQTAHDGAVGGLAVEQVLVARATQQAVDLRQLNEQRRHRRGAVLLHRSVGERGDHAIERQGPGTRQFEAHAAYGDRMSGPERLA